MNLYYQGYVEKTLAQTSYFSTQTSTQPTTETGTQTTPQEPSEDTLMEEPQDPSTSTSVNNHLPANLIMDSNKQVVVSIPKTT